MTPSLLSGAIVCPVRFVPLAHLVHLALFAALVAVTSPFAADSGQIGNQAEATSQDRESREGHSMPPGGSATATANAGANYPADDASSRQPQPERVPIPLPLARFERRSPRSSALNTITILH